MRKSSNHFLNFFYVPPQIPLYRLHALLKGPPSNCGVREKILVHSLLCHTCRPLFDLHGYIIWKTHTWKFVFVERNLPSHAPLHIQGLIAPQFEGTPTSLHLARDIWSYENSPHGHGKHTQSFEYPQHTPHKRILEKGKFKEFFVYCFRLKSWFGLI